MPIIISIQSFLSPSPRSDSERMSDLQARVPGDFLGYETSWGPEKFKTISRRELDRMAGWFETRPYNTLHCGATGEKVYGHDDALMEAFHRVVDFFGQRGLVRSVTIHGNDIGDASLPDRMPPGVDCLVEGMGSYNKSCNTFAEIAAILDAHPGWGLTLDTAHVLEMEARGEPGLGAYFRRLGPRIRHLHFSSPENPYPQDPDLAGFETQHSLAVLCPGFLATVRPFWAEICARPVTPEGVVPDMERYYRSFAEEMALFRPA